MSEKDCYCLTRSEIVKGEIVPFEEAHPDAQSKAKHSQDVWIIKGQARKVHGPFHIGVPGCDNRIAAELHQAGYKISNPSDEIICVHHHAEEERNYTMINRIPPPYLWVVQGGEAELPGAKRRARI